MKKILAFLLLFTLMIPAASAGSTITALASPVNPENLACTSVNARITDCTDNALSVELIVPEIFDREEVEALQVGDGIYTQGREVTVQTLARKDGYVIINEGEYEFSEGAVWLYEGIDGNYWRMEWDDFVWTTIASLSVPAVDHLLLLDGIDPETGNTVDPPTVYTAEGFLRLFEAEMENGGVGFAADNALAVFDGNKDLSVIVRYYVPWQ